MTTMLRIRFRQFIRLLADLGWWRTLIFGAGLWLFLHTLWIHLYSGRYVSETVLLMGLMITGIHINRPDTLLIKQLYAVPYRLYLTEYLAINLVWLPPCIAGGHFIQAGLALVSILLIPLIPQRVRIGSIGLPSPAALIPAVLFEWRSGSRVTGMPAIILWLAGLLFSQYAMALLTAIFVIFLLAALAFQRQAESLIMLRASGRTARNMLDTKTRLALRVTGIVLAPHLVVFLILHYEIWYALVTVYLAGVLMTLNSLYLRYATYEPEADNGKNNTLLAFLLACLLVPFLVPVPAVMAFIYRKRALNRLKGYYA